MSFHEWLHSSDPVTNRELQGILLGVLACVVILSIFVLTR